MRATVSEATLNNWKRTNAKVSDRLKKRANKQKSDKHIIPYECLDDKSNDAILKTLVDKCIDGNYRIEDVLMTLAVHFLKRNGIDVDDGTSYACSLLKSYPGSFIDTQTELFEQIPYYESDILGVIYQSLLTEGMKNKLGSYYTPRKIVRNMLSGYDLSDGKTLYDPCCGSGMILLNADVEDSDQLYGSDIDDNALFICKVNLLVKYPDADGFNIRHRDFLMEDTGEDTYDYIVTNPPWGAKLNKSEYRQEGISSNESSSLFIACSDKHLKSNGSSSFLIPKSLMNISSHQDIRAYILNHFDIEDIVYYKNEFTGVSTDIVNIRIKKRDADTVIQFDHEVKIIHYGQTFKIPQNYFDSNERKEFRCLQKDDRDIIETVSSRCDSDLANSIWAMGIVTGDNKRKLSDQMRDGYEPIYTGKEITPYNLLQPKKYIKFDPSSLQQSAREEIYRADQKLVYKFISKKLVFAIDETAALFLNSANILIPRVSTLSTKTVLALLNSALYQYLYMSLFDDCKILKTNLMELPFPKLSQDDDERLCDVANDILSGKKTQSEADDLIFGIFDLNDAQIKRINHTVNGTSG